MKPLYITAVVSFSGKTALLLGIALKLQQMGRTVGYFKPVSTQPLRMDGKLVDEDAEFVSKMLKLDRPAEELSSVVIDNKLFENLLTNTEQHDYVADIRRDYEKLGSDYDVMLVEGGASMREGYSVGISTVALATALNMPTLGVVRYRDGLMLIDDILAMSYRLKDNLAGIVINSVPHDAFNKIRGDVATYLERRGVKVYGVLPQDNALMALTTGELVNTLNARVLTGEEHLDNLVEHLSVGAMSIDAAMPHFRRTLNKAVITGGDRADLQAGALETSTTALILTGNLMPTSTILKRAEELGVAVLLVPDSTLETVEKIEKVFGKTRLAHPDKLQRYRYMLESNLDFSRLIHDLDL